MLDFEILEKIRVKAVHGAVLSVLVAVFGFFSPFMTGGRIGIAAIYLLFLGIFGLIFFAVYETVFDTLYGKPKYFAIKDFDNFTTSIYNIFEGEWDESSHDPDLTLPNCRLKIYTNAVDSKGKVSLGKEYQYSTTTERVYKKYYFTKDIVKVFKIYYMEFRTKEECDANQTYLDRIFNTKNNIKEGSIKHFTQGNIHIVFHAYAEDNEGRHFVEKVVSWSNTTRRAKSALKLK